MCISRAPPQGCARLITSCKWVHGDEGVRCRWLVERPPSTALVYRSSSTFHTPLTTPAGPQESRTAVMHHSQLFGLSATHFRSRNTNEKHWCYQGVPLWVLRSVIPLPQSHAHQRVEGTAQWYCTTLLTPSMAPVSKEASVMLIPSQAQNITAVGLQQLGGGVAAALDRRCHLSLAPRQYV